jgi:transcriptional regulator with XRE-family HTH domain
MKTTLSIGEKLRQLRVKQKLSQADLAKALFVKNTTISNWENDSRQIHLSNLKLLCVYFHVPLSYFTEDEKDDVIDNKAKRVPIRTILLTSATVALLVSGSVVLLNNQNNLINDACYGQETCYIVNDPAIVNELQTRNISGGLMTNVELQRVTNFLQQYLINHQRGVTPGFIAMLNHLGYEQDPYAYFVQHHLYHDQQNGIPNHIFDTSRINELSVQYLVENGDKYILYKLGGDRFRYEVYGVRSYELTIDLSLEAFYWENVKFTTPQSMFKRFLDQDIENQSVTVTDFQDFYFIDNRSTETISGSTLFASHSDGSFGFYDKLTHQFFANYIWMSYSDHHYEFAFNIQERSGIHSVWDFRFAFNQFFDGVFEDFPDFINNPDNITLLNPGHENENRIDPVNEFVRPFYLKMGQSPLTLKVTEI